MSRSTINFPINFYPTQGKKRNTTQNARNEIEKKKKERDKEK